MYTICLKYKWSVSCSLQIQRKTGWRAKVHGGRWGGGADDVGNDVWGRRMTGATMYGGGRMTEQECMGATDDGAIVYIYIR